MNPYYDKLRIMETSIPEQYSEKNLEVLEDTVTRYHFILDIVAKKDDEGHTEFVQERLDDIEKYLHKAKYGQLEKQRVKGYVGARNILLEGIAALIYILEEEEKDANV